MKKRKIECCYFEESLRKRRINHMGDWLPFDPQLYQQMVVNLQADEAAILNPPANDWTNIRRNALRACKIEIIHYYLTI